MSGVNYFMKLSSVHYLIKMSGVHYTIRVSVVQYSTKIIFGECTLKQFTSKILSHDRSAII